MKKLTGDDIRWLLNWLFKITGCLMVYCMLSIIFFGKVTSDGFALILLLTFFTLIYTHTFD